MSPVSKKQMEMVIADGRSQRVPGKPVTDTEALFEFVAVEQTKSDALLITAHDDDKEPRFVTGRQERSHGRDDLFVVLRTLCTEPMGEQ